MSTNLPHPSHAAIVPDRRLHLVVAFVAAVAAVVSLVAVNTASVGASTPSGDTESPHRALLRDIDPDAAASFVAHAPDLERSDWCDEMDDHAGDWAGFASLVERSAQSWSTSEAGMFEFVGVIAHSVCPATVDSFLASTD